MNALERNPVRPATRLDVQRHYLEEKRASYAYLDINAPAHEVQGDREGRLAVTLRFTRNSIANLLIAAGERIVQKPISEPADTTMSS